MSLSILVDMNLTPRWVTFLEQQGHTARHWSTVGDPTAADADIMAWALANNFIVFTHDMDFGTLLALSNAPGPSVLQIRTRGSQPERVGLLAANALRFHEQDLRVGALVVVEEAQQRVRVLPLSAPL